MTYIKKQNRQFRLLLSSLVICALYLASPGYSSSGQPIQQINGRDGTTLTFLSYNVYLLYADVNSYATMEARLALLPDELSATDADVIFIQELWGRSDKRVFINAMEERGYRPAWKESRSWWPPYFLGNGLLILVKDSISVVTEPKLAVFRQSVGNDSYTRKGVIGVTVKVPNLGKIDLFNTHTSYLPFDFDTYDFNYDDQDIMISQMKQIGELVNSFSSPYKVLGGDLNTHPYVWSPETQSFDSSMESLEIRYLLDKTDMIDTYELKAPGCSPTCFTWHNEQNTQIARMTSIAGGTDLSGYAPSSRIDYIFVSGEGVIGIENDLSMEARFLMTSVDQNEKEYLHLSDHFGWKSTLFFPTTEQMQVQLNQKQ